MAYYAVLASVVNLLQDKIHLQSDPSFPHSGRQMTMISLHKKFSYLLESLQGYSSKGDESADLMERRIRDAAYQAQDIIEFESPAQINSEDEALRKVGQEIDSIVKEVKIITETQSLEDLQLGDGAVGGGVSEQTPVPRDTPVGFDADLKTIKEKLCGDSRQFQVIPIFGMGGIGKTTLARNTYEDGLIKDWFDFRAWVTVSQHYSLERLVRSILQSFGILSIVLSIVEKELSIEELEKREKEVKKSLKKQVMTSKMLVKALEKGKKVDPKALDEASKNVKALKEQLMGLKKQLKTLNKQFKTLKEALQKGIKKDKEDHQDYIEEVEEDAEKEDEDIEEEEEDTGEIEEDAEEGEDDRGREVDREQKALDKCMFHLYQYLFGRKYLVVIDDVWSIKVWDDIERMFPRQCEGSGILVTTRLSDVADHIKSSEFSHKMDVLTPEDSWKLFQTKLVKVSEHFPSELENIGKVIVSKCGGLPLAIVVMAGMLSDKSRLRLQYWQKVERNVGSALAQAADKQLSSILSLSYNHLPHLQKACFLYMAIFPEDYEINISKLIRLWIAEGLFGSVDASKTLERVAQECLDDLVRRSLVTLAKKRDDGTFKFCVIHDVLRDFCRDRALREYSVHVRDQTRDTKPSGTEKVRRIILDSVNEASMPWAYNSGRYVHAVLWLGRTASSDVHRLEWDGFKHLKVMDISEAETPVAPPAVSRMFHLRYLALQLTIKRTKHIPPSIFKFRNLQTLIIYAPNCPNIILPAEIWEMGQVRHIVIDQMILPPMDGGSPLQTLEYLQTLQTVKNFTFTDEAINIILNLRILKISYEDEKVDGIWRLFRLTNLVHLSQLEELKITFTAAQFPLADSLPRDCSVFPPSLVKLSLVGCKLQWEELTAVVTLPNLQDLRLRANATVGDTWELPEEWELPKLRFLMMENLNIKYWEAEKGHFPCLERLKISACHELTEIPLDIGNILSLKLIEVYDSKFAGESARMILQDQQEMDNEMLEVHVRDS